MEVAEVMAGDFAMIRTHLLPFRKYRELLPTGLAPAGIDRASLREEVRRNLYAALRDPEIGESLRIASRSLWERSREPIAAEAPAQNDKLDYSLLKYFGRMTSRCTPFGLLAGVSWSPLTPDASGPSTAGIELAPLCEYRRHARIDMGVIIRLGARYLADENIRRRLRYFLNPTVHRAGLKWRYIEARAIGPSFRFEMSAIHGTDYLDHMLSELDAAEANDASFEDIVRILAAVATDTPVEDIAQYVDQLIENGVLISTLMPPLTGGDPFGYVVEALNDPGLASQRQELQQLATDVADLNARPLGSGMAVFSGLEEKITSLLEGEAPRDLLQTDLHKPARDMHLPASVVAAAKAAVPALLAFSPPTPPELKAFRQDFRERFGELEVPLLEALDPDIGLSHARIADMSPLLQGLAIERGRANESGAATFTAATELLVGAFTHTCRAGLEELVLQEAQIERLLREEPRNPPASFNLIMTVLDDDVRQPRIHIRGCAGPAIPMIGRFCTADEQLAEQARSFLAREEALRSDCIHAEIVHWPVDRIGNVLVRPTLRSHELPLFGRPMAARAMRLNVADLLVSVVGEEIVLRCRQSGRRVLPRLTNAHNTNLNSVALYRFLGMLQYQEPPIAAFRWPAPLLSSPWLPRVRYRNSILIAQSWQLSSAFLKPLKSVSIRDGARMIEEWVAQLKWPRFVELARADHCLCVDLQNPLSVEMLGAELRTLASAVIRETLLQEGAGFARSAEGSFCHELIVPFLTSRPVAGTVAAAPRPAKTRTDRLRLHRRVRHLPGGRWLSARIYTGSTGGEELIAQHLAPLMQRLQAESLLGRWFFLRYADPDPHIRLRFEGEPSRLWGPLSTHLHALTTDLSVQGLAWKVLLDTYEPEVDRYGGPDAISIAESLFHIDSQCALELIAGGHLVDPEKRWKLVAVATDALWRACQLPEEARASIYEQMARNMPLKIDRPGLDRKFRSFRPELSRMIFEGITPSEAGHSIIEHHSNEMAPLFARLHAVARPTESPIVVSIAHMRVNRLCISDGLAQEHVIYALLSRLLRSRAAQLAVS